jgi:predicted signal transduction protein with EAL and GGDEF domain
MRRRAGIVERCARAELKAHALLERLSLPFVLTGGAVSVGASIGVALQLPQGAQDAIGLLARLDHAMYEAKRKGKAQVALASPAVAQATS